MADISKLAVGAKITKAFLDSIVDRVNAVSGAAITPATSVTGTVSMDRLGTLRRVHFDVITSSSASASADQRIAILGSGDFPPYQILGHYLQVDGTRKVEECYMTTSGNLYLGGAPGASRTCRGTIIYIVP